MKTVNYTGTGQLRRTVLLAMLASKDVVKTVSAYWPKDGLFSEDAREFNLLGGWAVRHYRNFDEPVGPKIVTYVSDWQEAGKRPKEQVRLVEDLLRSLDGDYSPTVNVKFALDQAEKVFNRARQEKLVEKLQELRQTDASPEEFTKAMAEFSQPVKLTGGSGTDLLREDTLAERAFSDPVESIIKYPGAAGKFFGDDLCRAGFISFLAPEKRGKTRQLLDMAWRAMCQRRRVMFFSVGDLSDVQVFRRFAARAARRPWKAKPFRYPTKLEFDAGGIPSPTFEERTPPGPMSLADWRKVREKVVQEKLKSNDDFIKMWCKPARTFKASDVRATVSLQANQGWVPDVVVVDYADILAPESGTADTRDQINTTWIVLNSIRLEFNCLVVTATQADAEGQVVHTLTAKNFSEDKRKNAHVTGCIGINEIPAERAVQVQRLNWIMRREDETQSYIQLTCAGCPPICDPLVRTEFMPHQDDEVLSD